MNKIIKIAAALAAIGTMAQANAASTSIMIDPDGAGGMSAISVDSLNWLAGNVLTIGAGGTLGAFTLDYGLSQQNDQNTYLHRFGISAAWGTPYPSR
mgnify:CR=1 FL=1